jgi:ribonuclease P protein component
MTKLKTLASKDIAAIIQNGRRYRSRSFLVFVEPLGPDTCCAASQKSGKVAFIAPKRLGNAVLRNRCKRLLRAGFAASRQCSEEDFIYDYFNIILMATPKTPKRSSVDIAEEMTQLFTGLLKDATNKNMSN